MNIYLDTETLPVAADDPRWLRFVAARMAEPVKANGSLRDPAKIAADIADKEAARAADIEALRLGTSLDPMLGRIVCLCWAVDDGEVQTVYEDGGAMLDAVGSFPRGSIFIGHHLTGFDVPFLQVAAYRAGRPAVAHRFGHPDAKPWERPLRDTKAAWPQAHRYGPPEKGSIVRGVNGASLPSVAAALGIEVADGLDGSEVAEAYARGEHDRIRRHCQADVLTVREVYRAVWG